MMMLVPCLIMMMCHLLIFLDAQIARVIQHDVVESDDELETETPEHVLELAFLDMNCLRYRKVML